MQRYSNRLLRTRGFFDPIALRPIIGSSGALLVSASSASELPARIQFELSKFGIPAHMNSAKAQMTTEPLVQTGVEQAKRLGVSSIIGCGDKQALDRARGIQATLKNLHKYPVSLILVPSFISLTNYISEWQCVRAREGAIDAVLDSSQGYSPEVVIHNAVPPLDAEALEFARLGLFMDTVDLAFVSHLRTTPMPLQGVLQSLTSPCSQSRLVEEVELIAGVYRELEKTNTFLYPGLLANAGLIYQGSQGHITATGSEFRMLALRALLSLDLATNKSSCLFRAAAASAAARIITLEPSLVETITAAAAAVSKLHDKSGWEYAQDFIGELKAKDATVILDKQNELIRSDFFHELMKAMY